MKTIRALAVAAAITVLTGCGAPAEPSDAEITLEERQEQIADDLAQDLADEEHAKEEGDEWAKGVYPITKKMPDGSTVSCLILPHYEMVDMECDFAHATTYVSPSTEVTP